jgi:hypothetical protein
VVKFLLFISKILELFFSCVWVFLFLCKSFHFVCVQRLLGRPRPEGRTDVGHDAGDILRQLALAGFGPWLLEGVGFHRGQTDHTVCSVGASLDMHKKFTTRQTAA